MSNLPLLAWTAFVVLYAPAPPRALPDALDADSVFGLLALEPTVWFRARPDF